MLMQLTLPTSMIVVLALLLSRKAPAWLSFDSPPFIMIITIVLILEYSKFNLNNFKVLLQVLKCIQIR